MSTAVLSLRPPPVPAAPPRGRPVSLFLPREHGSWSLAIEPLALGLLVAPSWAGGALAGTVLAGFFARRPLKDSVRGGDFARRLAARETLVMWSALAIGGLFETLTLAPWTALWPLLPAAGLGALFVHCDAQGESRAAAAELAGSAAFACVPAALATLAGWSPGAALALGALALARSVPTVLVVRRYLRRAKGEPAGFGAVVLVSAATAAGVTALGAVGLVPLAAAGPAWVLLARTVWLASPWRPAWRASRLGMAEAVLGLFCVAAYAAAYAGLGP